MEAFAARLDMEILSTPSPLDGRRTNGPKYLDGPPTTYIHFLLNQRTLPLGKSFPACGDRDDGWCELTTFMEVQEQSLAKADYEYACFGEYEAVPYGTIMDGAPLGPASWKLRVESMRKLGLRFHAHIAGRSAVSHEIPPLEERAEVDPLPRQLYSSIVSGRQRQGAVADKRARNSIVWSIGETRLCNMIIITIAACISHYLTRDSTTPCWSTVTSGLISASQDPSYYLLLYLVFGTWDLRGKGRELVRFCSATVYALLLVEKAKIGFYVGSGLRLRSSYPPSVQQPLPIVFACVSVPFGGVSERRSDKRASQD
ncbi:hypothetical protein KC361_g141 [Hortaea werneckii]|nr:hypothetical protein KC361_g141 [Hortaea werneckii]